MEDRYEVIASLLAESKFLRHQMYSLMNSTDEEEKVKFMAGIGFADVSFDDFINYLSLQ